MQSEPLTRAAIITAARAQLGTPFRHQGRSAQGVDCVGLLICIGRALDLPRIVGGRLSGVQVISNSGGCGSTETLRDLAVNR